ncbi:MAG: hypothetical protein WC477_03845 [Patescibacteria group bacterium]
MIKRTASSSKRISALKKTRASSIISRRKKKVVKSSHRVKKVISSAHHVRQTKKIVKHASSSTHYGLRTTHFLKRPLHPCMRAMFISLAIGSVAVFGSMFYYIHVAKATAPILEAPSVELSAGLMQEPLAQTVRDLESQRVGMGLVPPREYLRVRAEQHGYDYDLLNKIAYCESKWRMIHNAKSSAFGYFQILDGTEKLTPQYAAGLSKEDAYANIDMAIFLYGKYGTIPWMESQPCWVSQ